LRNSYLILEREKGAGIAILTNLRGDKVSGWFENAPTVAIPTQFTIEEGRPDIVARLGLIKKCLIEFMKNPPAALSQI
jgi:hypothetical protein